MGKEKFGFKIEVYAYKEGRASSETEVTFGISTGVTRVTGMPLPSIN
jgi:hypothetical protein